MSSGTTLHAPGTSSDAHEPAGAPGYGLAGLVERLSAAARPPAYEEVYELLGGARVGVDELRPFVGF